MTEKDELKSGIPALGGYDLGVEKLWLSWSTGKDSAWSLKVLRERREYDVTGLLTTVNSAFDRVAMHGTRRRIAESQADAAGLPLHAFDLPWPCSNDEYDRIMADACSKALSEGVTAIAFGDLFLQEIRDYREKQLHGTGLKPIFPLWQLPTHQLAREMVAGGLRAKLVCVDPAKLESSFAGRDFDEELLASLPPTVDPCGENGEFHTCVYAGPMFARNLSVQIGSLMERQGFCYCDLLPA
jgi:uncharacterized protein (TIGR00290 family)